MPTPDANAMRDAAERIRPQRLHPRGALALALLSVMLTGCPQPPPMPVGRATLLEAHNANAEAVEALWAVADVEISFGPLGPLTAVRLTDGRLYYRVNPQDPSGAPFFMLRGMEAGVEVFRLATDPANGEFYYFLDLPGGDRQPWAVRGRLADLRNIPDDSAAALDPLNLAAAMGIAPWPTDPELERQAIVRVLDDPAVYEVSLVARVDAWDGWHLLRREIIDRYDELLRPESVRIHDRLGREAMRVDILRWGRVETAAETEGPWMATDLRIRPEADSEIRWIRLRLSGATTGNEQQQVPPVKSFRANRIPKHITDVRVLQSGAAR